MLVTLGRVKLLRVCLRPNPRREAKIMKTNNKSNKPFIGWKASEQRFYLDGMAISYADALRHWNAGTAIFLAFAEERIKLVTDFPLCARAMGWVADNEATATCS